jgi:hypothetical protein
LTKRTLLTIFATISKLIFDRLLQRGRFHLEITFQPFEVVTVMEAEE